MNAPMKYGIDCTRKRKGAIGKPERYSTIIIATGYDEAQRIVRDN